MNSSQLPSVGVPWTNVYGVARSLLALSTLTSLLFTPTDLLFRPFGETMNPLANSGSAGFSLFVAAPSLTIGRWLAVAILVVVVLGWRPRITGILHWYVSISFVSSAFLVEGGDQVVSVLTLLLVPVTLTDPRRWHWQTITGPGAGATSTWREVAALVARSSWLVIRLQVAAIYFFASVEKMFAPVWADGTALYYWVQVPVFGPPALVQHALVSMFSNSWVVTFSTWGVMVFELLLAVALVLDVRARWWLLRAGLLFHIGIIVIHGLGGFFLSMAGALVLYLRQPTDEFRWPTLPMRLRLRRAAPVADAV